MEMYWYGMIFVFGAIIGSFLNVVIYRLHTGRSVNGRSHCMTCGETLRWYELFPIVSYIVLRARCRTCSAYIPYRYLIVELLTGATFLLLYTLLGSDITLFLLHTVLASVLIVITVYDIRHTIIPDELTLVVGFVALIMLGYSSYQGVDISRLGYDILGGVTAGAFFYALWYFSKGRWIGLGDAKLALPLGIIAGVGSVLSMVVLSFWIGAGISLLLLGMTWLLKKGKTVLHFLPGELTMKSEVPFAPFLILGFLLAHLFHADIFVITAYLIPFGAI
jgi:leader peptidase (prepilin peptidase) / N-methyltransferase